MADAAGGRRAVSRRAVILAAAGLGLAACSGTEPRSQQVSTVPFGVLTSAEPPRQPTPAAVASGYPTATTEPRPSEPTQSTTPSIAGTPSQPMEPPTQATRAPTSEHTVDPAKVRANELGLVPVMMYHQITSPIASRYDTSPADFRAGLQRMFRAGYRPVSAIDLARGQLDVPAGYSPVVLTFDDGYSSQLRLQPDGTVDPTCAAGILLKVCRQFPDCRPAGTFNINKNPFGLGDAASQHAALTVLHRLGFEVGNHTYGHDNLARMPAGGIERDFVLLQRLVTDAAPGLTVRTMALPYGSMPQLPRAASVLRQGSWDGERYVNDATFLAGANPSPSPFASGFDPQRVPRVQSTSWRGGALPLTFRYWLDYLDAHPRERYVSAGRPGYVTIPARLRRQVAHRYADRVITY